MKAGLRTLTMVAAASAVLTACADEPTEPREEPPVAYSQTVSELELLAGGNGDGASFLGAVNARMAGEGVAALHADLSLAATAADPNFATVVFANDRTHRLGFRFAANDPRRVSTNFAVRQVTWAPLSLAPTSTGFVDARPAINASFATWNARPCADITTTAGVLPPNVLPSAMLGLPGFINAPQLNDINTIGFVPGALFDAAFGPGASQSVLGVTIPFVFIDSDGNPTDIDQDGYADLAFAEIWYNADFGWTTSGTGSDIDIETVALHENGHALGLAHFGRIAVNTSAGTLQVAPRAVMNAIVLGTLRSPLGTDNGSFCQVWANWK